MKLWGILRFELAYQLRRVPTWLYFAVLLCIVFFQTTQLFLPDARSGGHFLSAPFVVAQITVIDCLIWLVLAADVAGDAGARDAETGLHPLIHTAPITKADYLGGRFLAAFVLNAGLLLAVPAGMLIGLYSGVVEAAVRGPFQPQAYLTVYLFVALPTVFVTTAIQFSLAALSRRAIASYIGGVLLLAVVLVATTALSPLLKPEVVHLLDLLGIIAVDEWGKGATPALLNTQLVGLKGSWLASRLLWVGIALGALAFTYVRFRPGHPSGTMRGSRVARREDARSPSPTELATLGAARIRIPHVARTFGLVVRARQTLAIAWRSFGSIWRSWAGLSLLAVVGLLAALSIFESPQNLGVPLAFRTDYVLNNLTFPDVPPAYLIVPLLIVFWSGEMVWREREAGVSEVLDAAPVPEWVHVLGKFLGLALVLALCMALRMLAGVIAQVGAGYSSPEIVPYVQILFGLQLADYLLLAVLGLLIHVVVNQKHVGHVASLAAFVLALVGTELTDVHELLVYGSTPGWSYTDMRGFGASVVPWLWFKLYWGAWALLLLGAARLLWVRGREASLRARLRIARHRFTRRTAWASLAVVGLILTSGGFIFYQTASANEPAADERMERLAEYERRYERFEGIPQPLLTATSLHVEIYPDRRAVEIRGTHRLVNRSGVAIDSIQLAVAPDVETGEVTFDRPAAIAVADDELGHRIYALAAPLQPGDSLELDFEVRFEPRGFGSRGVQAPVAANGTNFTNAWLPAIGYQPFRELSDAEARQAHGLPPRPPIPSLHDIAARNDVTGAERIAFEAVVGTDDGQTAVAPGTLRRTWTEGGRRYFHYVADGPIGHEYFFFSAEYALHEERWNGVAIQIFHDPGSGANLERMVRSGRASLDYCTEHFGPYAHSYLRLVAIPGQGVGLRAETSTITYREGFALLRPEDDSRGFDLVFAVLAHEVGHICGAVTPARVEGAGVMSESLAWYRAFGVVKAAHGQEHLRRLLRWMREPHVIVPVRAAVPLLRGGGEYGVNRRGPFAMYALSEYIGEDRVDAALRRLREAHPSAEPPLPTTLDLYRELQAVTPDSLRYLLHDLFEANTLWDLETVRAVAEPTGAGAWQVTLDVRARKVVVDSTDAETEVPMDDWVQIGVFASADEGEASGGALHLQMHRVRGGDQTITVTVPRRPVRAGIDPHHLLIDLEVDDNVRDVTTSPGPRPAPAARP